MFPLYDCASSTNKISTVLKPILELRTQTQKTKWKKNKKFLQLTEKEPRLLVYFAPREPEVVVDQYLAGIDAAIVVICS